MRVENMEQSEAKRHALDAIEDVGSGVPFMAVVWTVEKGEVTMVGPTTYNFPTNDFLTALDLLVQSLAKEKGLCDRKHTAPPVPEPLPWALGVHKSENQVPALAVEDGKDAYE